MDVGLVTELNKQKKRLNKKSFTTGDLKRVSAIIAERKSSILVSLDIVISVMMSPITWETTVWCQSTVANQNARRYAFFAHAQQQKMSILLQDSFLTLLIEHI